MFDELMRRGVPMREVARDAGAVDSTMTIFHRAGSHRAISPRAISPRTTSLLGDGWSRFWPRTPTGPLTDSSLGAATA